MVATLMIGFQIIMDHFKINSNFQYWYDWTDLDQKYLSDVLHLSL